MARPRIGLLADPRRLSVGAWKDIEGTLVPQSYVRRVSEAGGLPIILPTDPALGEDPGTALDAVDGLVLIGGRDLDAALYGADAHAENDLADDLARLRDHVELAVAREALARDLPVLGACRGVQVLNVVLGGDLEQHLGDRLDPDPHRRELGRFVVHEVTAVAGSRLAGVLGPGAVPVASHHHQGIGRIADGLVPAAYAPDGVLEALEAPDRAFCVGVLWHPEEDVGGAGLPLFRALVEAAAARAAQPTAHEEHA